jgi:flavin reductase (DIM6/NTAB) family NADH-FMN oxidoreductase RutF
MPKEVLLGLSATGKQRSYKNIISTNQFVLNFVPEDAVQKVVPSSKSPPNPVNKFEASGLTPVPSLRVKPPTVGESYLSFECEVSGVDKLGVAHHYIHGSVVGIRCEDEILSAKEEERFKHTRPIYWVYLRRGRGLYLDFRGKVISERED